MSYAVPSMNNETLDANGNPKRYRTKTFYPSLFYNIRTQLYGFAYTNYDEPVVTKGVKEFIDASDLFTQQQKNDLLVRALKACPDRLGGLVTLARLNHLNYKPLLLEAYDLWRLYPVYHRRTVRWWVLLTDDLKLAAVCKNKQQLMIADKVYEPSGFSIQSYGVGGRVAYSIPPDVYSIVETEANKL